MVTGTSVQSSKDALRLSRLYPGALYATAGIHPHDAKSWNEDDEDTLAVLKDLIKNPEVVAIGECGLDFNRNFSPPNVQLDVFEKQVCVFLKDNTFDIFFRETDQMNAIACNASSMIALANANTFVTPGFYVRVGVDYLPPILFLK